MKITICSMCGRLGFCYAVPKYCICKECLPKWHEEQAKKFIEHNPLNEKEVKTE